ncbi:hypothetical protein [Bacteroides sp. GM023]|uniref:hypothetical protein n=1 Tax=Bacteroides sp. GM023 TaxID=2723058 RepID=UPI00168BA271|nr:hypothetical protein [Bacteroides sp. GM023]MBD3588181.1 hypothetical protein [Bacteroides sp. GM023]
MRTTKISVLAILLICAIYSYGQEEQYQPRLKSDTICVKNCPPAYKGYHQLWGYVVSNYYTVIDSLSYGNTYVATLSPVTMTPETLDNGQSIYSDRLLLIKHDGKKNVYDNVISNETYSTPDICCERLERSDSGFSLGLSAGMGWKIYYQIDIVMENGIPYIAEIRYFEHNSSGTYQRETTCSYPEHTEFPLQEYDRTIPEQIRAGHTPFL